MMQPASIEPHHLFYFFLGGEGRRGGVQSTFLFLFYSQCKRLVGVEVIENLKYIA